LYVLTEAKQLSNRDSETEEILSEEKENNCHVCVNGCANCGAGMICLMLTIACLPCYACPMTPASDFFGAGFFSFYKESKKDFRRALSSSALQVPLIDPHPPGPNRQLMS
jgi:hypothetical protein